MNYETVYHTFAPLFAPDSHVLLLGSMPSPKSREQGFYYGHPRNRFWPVLSEIFCEPCPQTLEEKRAFCLQHHIALWDVLASCDIIGAADTAIRNPVANPIAGLLTQTQIHAVFTTGMAAYQLYSRLCQPDTKIPAIKLPSTSPANAAWSQGRLVAAYQSILPYLK